MAGFFVTSDTHFGHDNIIRYCQRISPKLGTLWPSAAEMDEELIERWNTMIGPEDHIYHLGDVAMGMEALRRVMPRLHGKKRLILGNHDREDVRIYRALGFQKVYGAKYHDGVLMSHFPTHPAHIGHPRKVLGNVHGHIHEKPSPPGPYCNVSVERTDYRPVPWEVVKDVLRARKEAIADVDYSRS